MELGKVTKQILNIDFKGEDGGMTKNEGLIDLQKHVYRLISECLF